MYQGVLSIWEFYKFLGVMMGTMLLWFLVWRMVNWLIIERFAE